MSRVPAPRPSRFSCPVPAPSPDRITRLVLVLVAAMLALLFSRPASAAPPAGLSPENSSLLARDVTLDGTVLFMDAPIGVQPLQVVVVDDKGNAAARTFLSRKGPHPYETRATPGWSGRASMVILAGVRGMRGKVDRPGIADELDMFFAPPAYRPSLCNTQAPATLFGLDFQTVGYVLFGVFFVVFLFVFKTRRVKTALAAAFVLVLLVGDLRFLSGLPRMALTPDDNAYVSEIHRFRELLDVWADRIGGDTWTSRDLSWHHDLQARYLLSGRRHGGRKSDWILVQENGGVNLEKGRK